MYVKTIALIVTVVSISACQTPQTALKEGVPPLKGLLAIEVVSESCSPKHRNWNTAQTDELWQQHTSIESLTDENNGWVNAMFSNVGPRENLIRGIVSYNLQSLESDCSAAHQNPERSKALAAYSALISNVTSTSTDQLRVPFKDYIRPVAFKWSEKITMSGEAMGVGFNELYTRSNIYGFSKGHDSKYLERGWILLKSTIRKCAGIYQLTKRYPPKGTWNMFCKNGTTASGSFTLTDKQPYKDNSSTYYYRQAEGVGTDSAKQQVKFTMPWRDGSERYSPF